MNDSRTFQGFLKDYPSNFKDYRSMKNTDLQVKFQHLKGWTEIKEKLVLEYQYKIVAPLFGAANV